MIKRITQSISNQHWKVFLIGLFGILIGVFGGLLADKPIWIKFFDNLHWTSGTLAAAVCAWLGYKQALNSQQRLAKMWFLLGFSSYAIGQLIWDIQTFAEYSQFPSPSDCFYLWLAPCLVIALIVEIRTHKLSKAIYKIIFLDVLSLSVAMLTLVLVLYLPERKEIDLLSLIVLISYPVSLSIVVCVCIIIIPSLRLFSQSLLWFLLATIVTVWSWMRWNLSALTGSTTDGDIFNAAFSIAILIAGLASSVWQLEKSRSVKLNKLCDDFLSFLPMLNVILASTAVIFAIHNNKFVIQYNLTTGGALIVILLAMLRQGQLLHERQELLSAKSQKEFEILTTKNKLQSTLNAIPDLMFEVGLDGHYYDIRTQNPELLFLPIDELMGKKVSDVLPSDAVVIIMEALHESLEKNHSSEKQFKLDLPQGETWFELSVTKTVHSDNEQPRFIVLSRNVTNRKRLELLVQESEKRFRTVADAAPVLIWLANTDKLCHWFNKVWLDFTGRTIEDEYGNGWTECVHPDDFEKCLEIYVENFDLRNHFSMEYRLRRHDGEYRWIQDNGAPCYDEHNNFQGYIGSCVDITERVNSFEELKASQRKLELLKSMIEYSEDPFYILDINDDFRMIFANEATCKHFGVPKEQLFTMRVPDWDPDVDLEKLSDILPTLRENKHLLLNSRHSVKDGIVPVEISINYLKNEDGEYTFGYIIDLRERIKLEDAMRNAKEHAEQLAKSKSDFLANMSHEIRTPMTAIIGLSQLALNKQMSNDVRDYLTKIHQSSESLLGILNDILDFSKLDAGKLQLENSSFNLVEMFRNLYNLFSVSAKNKNLEFSISAETDMPSELIGDSLRIQQILSNLLGNAIKFTAHGKVWLHIKTIENRIDETVLRFSVEDTGIGLETEHQENLFKQFHQADNSITRRFGGTGLGLTISRDLLRLMNSDFHINSTVGKGTTIYFDLLLKIPSTEIKMLKQQSNFLPVNQQGALQERLSEMSQSLVGIKVLLAEDNSLNQEIVSGFLKLSGIEVDIAENGIVALEFLKLNSYDVILMDINMPKMDGLQATKAIREQSKYAELPIIALTAGITIEEQEKCLSVGMNTLVEKPINPEILLQTLLRVKHSNNPLYPRPERRSFMGF